MSQTPKSSHPLDLEAEDKIIAAANDVIGIFHIIRMGSGVYLRLGFALALIIGASAAVMSSARFLGKLVEKIVALVQAGQLAGQEYAPEISRLGIAFLALECTAVLAQYFGRVNLAHATIEIAYKIRCQLFTKMQKLPITYFDTQPLGRTITRLTSDVEGVETFFSGTLARVLIAMINIVAVLIAMVLTDFSFGIIMVGISLPAMCFSFILRRPVIHWLRTYKRRSAHINAKLAEYLNGIPVIKIFGLEAWTQANFDEAADSLLKAGLRSMNWNSFIRPMAVFLCSLPTLVILWVGGSRVLAGTMELGLLVAFVRYGERFVSPIRVISTEIQNIQEAVVSSERVRRMLKEPEELDSLGPDGDQKPALSGRVEYKDVWMSYDAAKGKTGTSARQILKGVSFAAEPGMKIGLVGATGSGKTTTVNLLPRLYPFQRGDILVDGMPIARLQRDHLRDQLGYVSQDVVVFSGTVRANLLGAHPRATEIGDEEILAACRKTGLAQVIANFSKGLDHILIDGGENLSMGERQLIAFTRMLLRNPAVLILDEATANIDEHYERLIQHAITEVMEGRTCFVIAHRLSTIIQCDKILVFAHGEVIEQGTHAELMARGGHYAGLAGKQLIS